jgi:hypothetical protein
MIIMLKTLDADNVYKLPEIKTSAVRLLKNRILKEKKANLIQN